MNIVSSIEDVARFTKQEAVTVARYACGSPARFKMLINCLSSNQIPLSTRAAWCTHLAVEMDPAMVYPHLAILVDLLDNPQLLPAVGRSCLGILRDVEIPEQLQEKTIYHCFEIVQDLDQPIAARSSALQILGKLAVSWPEIKAEIKAIIEYQEEYFSPGLIVAARKVLKLFG